MKRRTLLKSAATCLAVSSLRAIAATGSRPVTEQDINTPAINAFADAARRLDRLHAVVVMQQGEIILSEAFRGPPVHQAVNIKSVSKSVVAALVGCALERQSGRNYGRWAASDDWVRYALTRPFTAEPGGRMLYSTAGWHVLGALLSEITGKSLLTLSREWLGKPLGIEFAPWTRDPQGRYLGGNEMSMSPLEMVRFGELYRLGGRWNGKSVMSDDWVRQSFEPRTVSPWSNDGYGYGWFLRPLGDHIAAYARGYGGQIINVIPQAGLVVAMTSDTSRAARSDGYMATLHSLVGSYRF